MKLSDIPSDGTMITSADVAKRICISIRTLWRLVKAGKFPQPVRYTNKIVRWRLSDVIAHINGEKQ